MNEWFANPLFWIVFLSLLSVAAGAIFAFGQWKGRVDSDRALFKGLMAEIRNDIKEILRRLPSHTLTDGSASRLTDLGKSISERFGGALGLSTRLGGIDVAVRMMVASIRRI